MMRTNDTIAAISTGLTPGGIGIVRISGEDAVAIGDKLYQGKVKLQDCPSHTIHYGYIVDGEGRRVDQVLVSVMLSPRTYTGEDTVEINCHGGILVMKKILSLALAAGANLAEPGEFTKRAFLNGKIDLAQAEAVMDVIEAEDSRALNAGMKQLGGGLSVKIRALREEILLDIAYIEAALDDPEHYDLAEYPEELSGKVSGWRSRLGALLKLADSGIVLKSGVNTVIIGRPNAGKSSIYNMLTRSDKAIVTEIAGTTRDTLTEHIRLGDVSLHITDTAGLRESDDVVERIGVDRARAAAEEADLILCVIDGSAPLTEEDLELLRYADSRQSIILYNKADLFHSGGTETPAGETAAESPVGEVPEESPAGEVPAESPAGEVPAEGPAGEVPAETVAEDVPAQDTAPGERLNQALKENLNQAAASGESGAEYIRSICISPLIVFSAEEGTGLEELETRIRDMFYQGALNAGDEVIITSLRHKDALLAADRSLQMVEDSIAAGLPEDFFSIDLTAAYEALGTITGETLEDDIIDKIFEKFCMGK